MSNTTWAGSAAKRFLPFLNEPTLVRWRRTVTERLQTHTFKKDKANPYRCEDCPYLANNPIHRHDHGQQMVRGTARPTKFG